MAHKTLIDGTAYAVKGGRDLIAGTGYAKKQGKTLIDGTEHAISFGIPLNTITPGAILYLNESGSPVPFYIAKHDYESGLNGDGRTLVVRKDCYDIGAAGKDEQSGFLLFLYEFGITATNAVNEGTPLPIADTLKAMTRTQWTRTVNTANMARAFYVDSTYGAGYTNVYNELGIRPAFTLPGTLRLAQNADGTYTLAA